MTQSFIRRSLAALALVGLVGGLLVARQGTSAGPTAGQIWTAATLPVLAALVASTIRDFLIGRFGADAIALASMATALFLDQPLTAIVVALMYTGGVLLEDFARGRAQRELRAFEDRSPRTANRRRDGWLETVDVSQILVGEELLVRAGERVAVDGTLLDAEARLDESALTGEPLPVTRYAPQLLRSGTVNAGDTFAMRATATAAQSTYAGILRLVAAAHTARAPLIRTADWLAVLLLPGTLLAAAGAWWWTGDPLRGLAVLVIATPCPLILAAPVAFNSGVSLSARAGVLMKGSPALESLTNIGTAVFDKTGTLTLGGAELLQAEMAPGSDENEVWRLAASLEQASRHVVAGAIVDNVRKMHLPLHPPVDMHETRGSGLSGEVSQSKVRVGSRAYVLAEQPLPLWCVAGERRFRGQPVLRAYVEVDHRVVAVLTFGDAVRADAAETIQRLRSLGVSRVVLLTGDDEEAALRLGAVLPLDRVVAHATPQSKVEALKEELKSRPTMMIGDGINDASALATATVGVAVGAHGVTASSEAADMVVLPDRLLPIAEALAISQRTRRIAFQSIVAGLFLSVVGMTAAAAEYLTPVQGALFREGIDLAVILNALRALRPGHTLARSHRPPDRA